MIRLCFSPVKEDVLALVIVVHPLVLKFHLNNCQKQQNRKQNPAICGSRTHFIVTEAVLINAFNHHHCRAKRAAIGGHDHNLRKQLEGVNQADNQDKEKRRSQQWQCNSCTVAMVRSPEYKYSFANSPINEIGCPHAPHPWILSLANSLLCGRVEHCRAILEKISMDNGIACESVDEVTGYCTTGEAFATCAGFLCHSIREALSPAVLPMTAV